MKSDEILPSDLPLRSRTSTEILYRPTTSISHHRSNTIPSHYRKTSENQEQEQQQQTHLSPTYKRKENVLIPIPIINDDVESPSS